MSKELYRLFPFLLWPIVASGISFALHVNLLESIFVFFAVPAIYLSIKRKNVIRKVLFFSLSTSIPIVIIWDYIAHTTRAWLAITVFSKRLLGSVAFEDLLWGFAFVYFVVMFYEYFFENPGEKKAWHPRMTFLVYFLVLLLIIFMGFYFLFPNALLVSYSYFWVGVFVILIPLLIELSRRPNLIAKFALTGAYFSVLNLFYEITALKLDLWAFPGHQYVGLVSIAGIQFPIEEFTFYILLCAIAVLSYYEPFDDDEK